jgi:Carboxypeptidase regulatory-like domain
MKNLAYSVMVLLSIAAAAWAQTSGSGTISGTLTDPNGAVIPNATVTILNVDTGIERSLASNGAGLYTAPFLQPGHYQVTASKAGFSKIVRQDLTLQVGQTLTVDLSLSIQATSETVTVTGQASLVDPDKTEMSQTVTQIQQ